MRYLRPRHRKAVGRSLPPRKIADTSTGSSTRVTIPFASPLLHLHLPYCPPHGRIRAAGQARRALRPPLYLHAHAIPLKPCPAEGPPPSRPASPQPHPSPPAGWDREGWRPPAPPPPCVAAAASRWPPRPPAL